VVALPLLKPKAILGLPPAGGEERPDLPGGQTCPREQQEEDSRAIQTSRFSHSIDFHTGTGPGGGAKAAQTPRPAARGQRDVRPHRGAAGGTSPRGQGVLHRPGWLLSPGQARGAGLPGLLSIFWCTLWWRT